MDNNELVKQFNETDPARYLNIPPSPRDLAERNGIIFHSLGNTRIGLTKNNFVLTFDAETDQMARSVIGKFVEISSSPK